MFLNIIDLKTFQKDYAEIHIYAKTVANVDTNKDNYTLAFINKRIRLYFNGEAYVDYYDAGKDITYMLKANNLNQMSKYCSNPNIAIIPFGRYADPINKHNNVFGVFQGIQMGIK